MKDAETHKDRSDKPEGQAQKPVRRRSRRRRAALWAMRGTFILIFLAAISALMVVGQRMHAPQWLRDRVEHRIEQATGGLQIKFGDVSFIIHEGWRPRLRLRDVTLSDSEGRQIAQLSDMRASLAMRPLLRGEIRPKRIMMSGAHIALQRDKNGQFSLVVGQDSEPVEQAPNVRELIEEADTLFMAPALSALTSFELDAITLFYSDLRQNRSWTLDGGHIQITRGTDEIRIATGFSLLGGRDYASAVEMNYTSKLGSPEASFGVSVTDLPAEDIALQSPVLAWLQVLRAPLSGALRGSVGADGSLDPVFATLQIAKGVVQPNPEVRPIPFDTARTYFSYDPKRQFLDFSEISIASPWGSAVIDGRADLEGVEGGQLKSLTAQFRSSGIKANPAGMYAEALELSGAAAEFQLKFAPFRLRIGQLVVEDKDRRLRVFGSLKELSQGWGVDLDAQLDHLTPAQLLHYWPEKAARKPRKWVSENLLEGRLEDLDLAVRLRPGARPQFYADFDYKNAKIKFAKTLPPVVDAQGQASLVGSRFTVTAQRGRVIPDQGGAIDAAGTSFIIPDIGIKKAAPGIARIRARGSATAALSLLDRPPLQVMTKAGLPVDLAQGLVSLEGTLALPLRDEVRLADMEFHYAGDVGNVKSDKLVPGMEVSADRLDLSGDQTQVSIAGQGYFGAVPMQGRWTQPIGGAKPERSRLVGQIELSPRLMTEIHAGLPDGMLTGVGTADVTVDLGGGKPPYLTAQSDLVGVGLAIPELGWRKAAASSGLLTMAAELGAGMNVDEIKVDAAGLRTTGSISFSDGAQMDRVRLSSFELGSWLSVPVELVSRGNRAPDIRILGGRMDMRTATFGSGGSGGTSAAGGDSPDLEVRLDRLQITDTIALTGFQGGFRTLGGLGGTFTARVNGGTAVSGQVAPRGNRSGIVLQSADAGGVLRSSGILTQAHGGSFRLTLEPVQASGYYDAVLRIANTRVKDAPAMAALLNAISLVGLLDEMSGQGIYFTGIDSRMRISPTEVTVLSGSAVGPSIGLSFDGKVNTERRWLDLRGAVTPVYLLNAIGSVLTRKGEGVFAFNYTLNGPISDPKVGVNPLSGLAPVFLRDLLRKPRPAIPDDATKLLFPDDNAPKETPKSLQGSDR